jgi:hypothetical protein
MLQRYEYLLRMEDGGWRMEDGRWKIEDRRWIGEK